jgi:uncharacterized protein (TIGR03067 family)
MTCRLVLTMTVFTLLPCGIRSDDTSDLARDRKLILGTWSVTAYDQDGKSLPPDLIRKMSVVIQAEKLVISPRMVARRSPVLKDGRTEFELKFAVDEGKTDEANYRLDLTKKGKVIELTQDLGRGETIKITGLYSLEGDSLTICLPLANRKVPKKMPEAPKAGLVRMILKKG